MALENLLTLFHKREVFFRFENDESGFTLSIIDRRKYPRIWADNFQDNQNTIIAETTDNLINRTVLAEKDWEERFFGETIDDLVKDCQNSKIIIF